jgi:hypothetical protein
MDGGLGVVVQMGTRGLTAEAMEVVGGVLGNKMKEVRVCDEW